MTSVRVVRAGVYHHLADWEWRPRLEGMTLRAALRALRAVWWGDLGGMIAAYLSDGTRLSVVLRPAAGGGDLMGSQYILREDPHGRDRDCAYKI